MSERRSNIFMRLWRQLCNRLSGRHAAFMKEVDKEIITLLQYRRDLADAGAHQERRRLIEEKISALIKRLNATVPYADGDLLMPKNWKPFGGAR